MRRNIAVLLLIPAAVLLATCGRDFSNFSSGKGGNNNCVSLYSIEPDHGENSEDVNVLIRGDKIVGPIQAWLGAEELSDVLVITATLMSAVVPAEIMAGTYDLTVIQAGCTSVLPDAYLAIDPGEIAILSIVPSSAPNDEETTVTVTGINFTDYTQISLYNSSLTEPFILEDVEIVNSTTLYAVIPEYLEAGSYDVTVQNNTDSSDTLIDGFTVLESGALYVRAISPTSGSNADDVEVTITGRNFEATPGATLGDNPLEEVLFVTAEQITAIVPAGLPPAVYDLTVTNPDSESFVLEDAYEVIGDDDDDDDDDDDIADDDDDDIADDDDDVDDI